MIRINMPTMLPCVPKEAEAVKLVRSLSAYFSFSFSFSLTADKLHSTFKRSNICLFKPKINKNDNNK